MKMSSEHVDLSNPNVWGPVLWKFLHIMAFNYPENPNPQTKASSRQFFYSLRHLLPCETCRIHYNELISKRQPETDSAKLIQEWVLWLHNEVSARTNPNAQPWSMSQLNKSLFAAATGIATSSTCTATLQEASVNGGNDSGKHERSETNTLLPLKNTPQTNDIQFSPRSKDKNYSFLVAQNLHRRLSASRSSVANVNSKDTLPKSNTVHQPSLDKRQLYSRPVVVKNSHKIAQLHPKNEITYAPYNNFNRKSMLPRNGGRSIQENRRGAYSIVQRGKGLPLSNQNSTTRPTTPTTPTTTSTTSTTSTTCATSNADESGTKKNCGCKNKK